jgi:hypothetical protein
MKKIKEIFIKSNDPHNITPCYHGFCYYDFIRNRVITAILPFNFVVMILRSFYFMLKFSGHEMDRFYQQQRKLRGKNER